MRKAKAYCPNPKCSFHIQSTPGFCVKKGYYLTQWNHQKVPRYQCRACKKKFSSHTFYRTYKQKKPYLNEPIFQLYCSATTQRRIAKLLKINFKTVVRKFLFLAKNAESEHLERLSKRSFDVSSVQFDEMLSFEHTRLKPLSIALAVQKKGHKVIDIQVAECHYQGRLSAIALSKYGPRLDKSNEARKKVLETLQSQVQKTCHIITDAKPQYKSEASRYVPLAQLHQINNRGGRLRRLLQSRRRNIKDPMFELNLVAAKIRHNLSRMARKVWVTTKKAERLQKHLLLFIAYHNEYSVAS